VAGLSAATLLGCGDDEEEQATPTPMPPPETTTIRLGTPSCCGPLMASEPYLREEGFTDIQLQDAPAMPVARLVDGTIDLGIAFPPTLANAIDTGRNVVGIGPVHPGCIEIWATSDIQTLRDVRGRRVVVRGTTADDPTYPYYAMFLKEAGVAPSEVNWMVQPGADFVRAFLEGQSDLLYLATTGLAAWKRNPARTGHVVLDQVMAMPWAELDCCIITTTTDWLRANPVAAKRALRAIYRAADALPVDRLEAAKTATDKGLFGGANNLELVREAANMVPFDWRKYDVAESMRFHTKLLNEVGLVKVAPDEMVAKATDGRFAKELASELKKPS
jgi:NitT/TauT family transport system substrate-binding protein